MHYTKGWEYHSDPAIMGSGALAATADERDRRSKRVSSSQHKYSDRSQPTAIDGRLPASRQQSAKGKARATNELVQVDPDIGPADRSRSRSQRRRDPDSDLERNGDRHHQRRLREVRGSHRKKNHDQT